MADAPRPKLEVVDGGAAPDRDVPPDREQPPQRRSLLPWALGLLLLLALIGLGAESRRAAALQAELTELGAELERSQASLVAHERHLTEVRTSVADLEASLTDLRDLVAHDPAPNTPATP